MNRDWWKSAVIYQITLNSFYDGNNDGIGDFIGLTKKLDYLKTLGVDAVWVSPHYASPMDDNGYDVSDFYQVNPDYGTLDDFRHFVHQAHQKNIRVITDLVLNHTSDEHAWFKIACDPTHPKHQLYHDFYIWQDPKIDDQGQRQRPTSWLSWFGGPTWDYVEAVDQYYLHIFSKKMPDLNWRNVAMREEMKRIIRFWIDLGVDGFRVDAANHLEKNWDFPDAYPGYEHFSSLPKHHEYLEDLGVSIFKPNQILTIGESGGATKEQALKYVGFDSNEFNLLIHFGHVWADIGDDGPHFNGKWSKGQLHVSNIKKSFNHWFRMLEDKGWNLIYWHNHDHPRVVSHYGDDGEYRVLSAKMLAIALYLMPGTSITYQGEEIGMTNLLYDDINDFRDVEVFTEYNNFIQRGASEAAALQALRDRSRDNARSPMQWSDDIYAGFSKHQPWMKVNMNYQDINVKKDLAQEDSIWKTYQFLLHLRQSEKENIPFGKIRFIDLDNDDHFCYVTKGKTKSYLVLANFRKEPVTVFLGQMDCRDYRYFYGNLVQRALEKKMTLGPYEALVYVRNN